MTIVSKTPTDDALAIVRDATCTFCGCMCDDIDLTVAGKRIVAAERACRLGQQWFASHEVDERPSCLIGGRPASIADGIERAAQILTGAKYPMVFGLSDTTCEAQRVAAGIADWIGGILDTTTSLDHGPVGVTFQGVGEVTCSLGEVANRGDLIIFWGANPAQSHPRHFERYSLEPEGMFLPGGRRDRTCVVIDVEQTETTREADVFLQIKPDKDFEAAWTLRALAMGIELNAAEVEAQTGVPLASWQDLMVRMKRAQFGVILFGTGLTTTRGRHLNSEAVLALVHDMNAFTRFVAKSLRERGNITGADSVVTWRTGFPFGVNLSRGYPRFNPGEYTATEMLARGEVDAAMIVASDPLFELSAAAQARLATIPYISLDFRETATTRGAAVAFTTATYGIHTPGTVYRMDDVPLPLRPALDSRHPSDFEILSALEKRVRELTNARGK